AGAGVWSRSFPFSPAGRWNVVDRPGANLAHIIGVAGYLVDVVGTSADLVNHVVGVGLLDLDLGDDNRSNVGVINLCLVSIRVVQDHAIKIEQPLRRVGRQLLIHLGGLREPIAGLVASARRQQQ